MHHMDIIDHVATAPGPLACKAAALGPLVCSSCQALSPEIVFC